MQRVFELHIIALHAHQGMTVSYKIVSVKGEALYSYTVGRATGTSFLVGKNGNSLGWELPFKISGAFLSFEG